MNASLDAYDLKLLAELQRDASTAQSELGLRVNLSTAAVNRRLKRLCDEGVIERYSAIVAPDALGHELSIIVEVEVESERIDHIDALKRNFQACPQVQQCYYVAGECDFVLIFCVRNMAQYTQLTRELFFDNPNVKRFKTLVAMNRVKVGLEVPTAG
ncbi:Lrp/AsnC family transcriptional regulator [Pseudomonas protegens]|uniref:Lrp/AsnC family transcriptional regulator n=1 Tax=Pseudomonas protegens TaxID=380021 RepID=UPI001B3084A2|nr:Lrp/AsnC family transcriptional regulator [Pseudomonas protegens]MBP5096779.1 Lrp/AsnC family transcriptional regulator [Pseudomonas protegens]MBP5102749.1 Lrp/AsnC family transcriptional regulator [Pseudomonas protegens]MBP5117660.1 Lrp/AsnC family transcriptional regulator [Pseudomonas protegens]MBP5125637.1 Lrp/AsnC family transcriptional regulator [Pseudomonas protegens]MBP5129146.1 Lrp/AsnC family transcriptional regulator [Pseudomonas protegens]